MLAKSKLPCGLNLPYERLVFSSRCVVLSDPLKDSSRSQESWNSLLLKLRTLLLMSFTKNLGRFEDEMRTLREKRTQPGWSFCEYFMVQVHGKKRQNVGLCVILSLNSVLEGYRNQVLISSFVLCVCRAGGAGLCFWNAAAVWGRLGPVWWAGCSFYPVCP